MNDFRRRLKELRVAAGLSQQQLANELQISIKSQQRYENGFSPDTYILTKIARYFNVSTDYLLGLKSFDKEMEEQSQKLRGKTGYNELYSNYIKCINNYEVVKDATYYWIYMENGNIGGQTEWTGWYDEEHMFEVRRLRPVNPQKAIEMCTRIIGKPMVVNSPMDVMVFLIYGGQTIIREDICKIYLPEFLEEYIEPVPVG